MDRPSRPQHPRVMLDSPSTEPSARRKSVVFLAALSIVASLYAAASALGPHVGSVPGAVGSVVLGMVAALVTASVGEWCVHRYFMHRPYRWRLLNLPYDLHHRAHHWVQFPPDEFVQIDRVQRVPPGGGPAGRVCTTGLGRFLVVLLHLSFYSIFAVVLAVLPSFLLTGNPVFAVTVTLETALFLFLFVHVHDAVHHPGLSPLERFRWFRFLDRHHYVHHVDTEANTNFLLPLADLSLGTLRRELTPAELRRWPSYEEARRHHVVPHFAASGVRIRGGRASERPVMRGRAGARAVKEHP